MLRDVLRHVFAAPGNVIRGRDPGGRPGIRRPDTFRFED